MKTIEELILFRFPIGFPFVLFSVKNKTGSRFVLADTPERASALANRDGKGKPSLVDVSKLVDKNGYNQTHRQLKQFGKEWITKYNRAFFRHGPVAF